MEICRKEQPFVIRLHGTRTSESISSISEFPHSMETSYGSLEASSNMETGGEAADSHQVPSTSKEPTENVLSDDPLPDYSAAKTGKCLKFSLKIISYQNQIFCMIKILKAIYEMAFLLLSKRFKNESF